jgi:hypothetical protein
MATGTQKSKLDNESKGTVVEGEHRPQAYFHPGSATLLFVEAKDNKVIQQECSKLAALLEEQKKHQLLVDDINYEILTQVGKKPQRVFDSKLKEAYAQLNDANNKLKAELKVITAKIPEGELLDENSKESAIGIMELIPLKRTAGFKSIYIRSDRIRSHWRKYKLSEIDKKSGEASFIKYHNKQVLSGYDEHGNEIKKTVRSAAIDTDELQKQLKTVPVSMKFEKELLEDSSNCLFEWAKKMNKGLVWPKESDSADEESTYHQYVDISVQAQLMRYSQGAGLSAEFNPLEGKASAKIAGHASFALGEAKASTAFYIPDRLGTRLLFPAKASADSPQGGVCNMGALRYAINAVLSGSAGASLGIELGVEVDASGEMAMGYGIKGSPAKLLPPPQPGQREINLALPAIPDAKAGGEIGAFVGIQAGGNISGAIEWFDPHPEDDQKINAAQNTPVKDAGKPIVPKEKKFTAIATLTLGANFQAGAGGSGVFYVTYINSRFRIYCKAALCWGVGGKGSIGFEVDGNCYLAFMKSFMYMLRNVDYQKLEQMMEVGSFQALCAIPLIMAARGVQAVDAMLFDMYEVLNRLEKDFDDENKRVKLMHVILEYPDQFKYTPPETKGALIAMLIDSNWVDWIDPRNQNNNFFSINAWKIGPLKLRKQAVFMALKWVQSKADYNNVMQHLTLSPGEMKGNQVLDEHEVINFLSIGELKMAFFTNYGEKLKLLYDELPDAVGEDEPFRPIPEYKMAQYLAVLDKQHPDNTLIA